MSSSNGTSSRRNGPSGVMAVDTCSTHAHGIPEKKAEQAVRTSTSLRAEAAFRDWSRVPPSERPLIAHRAAHARVLFQLLRDHEVSRAWFALQIGVDAKQVHKMLKGEVSIPVTISSCMPNEMRADYIERLGAIDGINKPSLQDRIDRLDKSGLLDALTRITAALGAK